MNMHYQTFNRINTHKRETNMSGHDPQALELPEERRRDILNLLGREGKIKAAELAARYAVSEDTIRRDLRDLAEAGLLLRVHGGALPVTPAGRPYAARRKTPSAARDRIAEAAARLVKNNQIVFFDSGATVRETAARLRPDIRATAVTASPDIALALAGFRDLEVILIGGRLIKSAMTAAGARAVRAVGRIRADMCLLGVCGLHPEYGVTAVDFEEAQLKRAFIENAADVAALASPDKLGAAAAHQVAPLSRLTHLVTTTDAPEDKLAPYRAVGIEVVQG